MPTTVEVVGTTAGRGTNPLHLLPKSGGRQTGALQLFKSDPRKKAGNWGRLALPLDGQALIQVQQGANESTSPTKKSDPLAGVSTHEKSPEHIFAAPPAVQVFISQSENFRTLDRRIYAREQRDRA